MTVPFPVALALAVTLAATATAAENYADVLEAYRRGEADAVERLAKVPEGVVAQEIRRLQELRSLPYRCRKCDETRVIDTYPYVAAAVLHTERGIQDDGDGQFDVGSRNFSFAREWLRLASPDGDPVFRQWYLTGGTHLIGRVDLEGADRLLEEGTRTFPSDALLWQASGIAAEMRAHLTREADHVHSSNHRYLAERMASAADIRGTFGVAERRYRQALDADPALVEARIRLGRVLTELDRPEDAVRELEAAARGTSDPADMYLAHLLAGRAEEGRGRLPAALEHYRLATAALPAAEAGWVALAHALDRAGERGRATTAVARVVAADTEPEIDPYRAYHVGPRVSAAAGLAALKAWVK